MNKPITEKDFDALTEKILEDAGQYVYMSCNVTEQYFELAKRMAIDFIAWIAINEYHVVLTERGGKYWTKGFQGARISNEQLFELYQQQNNG